MSAAISALREWGSCIRGDWGDIDGRSVKAEMNDLADALEGIEPCTSWSIEQWRTDLGMCPTGDGHWTRHCSSNHCGNEPTRW